MFDPTVEKYVSLTTFRRNGDPVAVPVWIAPLGDGRHAFTTDPASGKVKRVRNNASVELRPCSVRGKVAPDAPVVTGTAQVVTDAAEYRSVVGALKRKYGLQVSLVELGGRVKQLVKRRPDAECALIITLT
jgi:PPOX class probable F420-dependent enzyme